MHCNLSALAKEESRAIDIYMLLNTEILKKVSPEPLPPQGPLKSILMGFSLLQRSWLVPMGILPEDAGWGRGGEGGTRGSLFKVWAKDPQQHLPRERVSHAESWTPPRTC